MPAALCAFVYWPLKVGWRSAGSFVLRAVTSSVTMLGISNPYQNPAVATTSDGWPFQWEGSQIGILSAFKVLGLSILPQPPNVTGCVVLDDRHQPLSPGRLVSA